MILTVAEHAPRFKKKKKKARALMSCARSKGQTEVMLINKGQSEADSWGANQSHLIVY